ncbi:MAG: hypothetical protein JHC37_06400 [Campylobacteraceae bacterium]|jgi:hypothetical protein|nr:hypothetical protein [Campylobacteraceae bacterium]
MEMIENLHDKQELLDELATINGKEEGLGLRTVLTALATLVLAVGITMPKIYLSSSIYYLSLETDSLYSSYKSLKEENRYLEQKLEFMRYKNSVLRTLD